MDRRNALKSSGLLAGVVVLSPAMIGSLFQSCKAESRSSWQPLFFNQKEAQFVTSYVETMIPKTDTPGGLDVKVDMFLDKLVAENYDDNGRSNMRIQLSDFIAKCQEKRGEDFSTLSKQERMDFLRLEESESGKYNPGVWGTSVGDAKPINFAKSLKSTVAWIYLTSEEIGKNVLSYDPIPGEYNGCLPVEEIGNKWSI